jgi:hypothetical protein
VGDHGNAAASAIYRLHAATFALQIGGACRGAKDIARMGRASDPFSGCEVIRGPLDLRRSSIICLWINIDRMIDTPKSINKRKSHHPKVELL